MDNIWLLTEERPKISVILQIIDIYCSDFNDNVVEKDEVKIRPIFKDGVFTFTYVVENLKVENAENIFLKIVSGSSSFIDFLLFKQKAAPVEGDNNLNNLLMAVEETKTSDDESRNTGVYQRGSKFVFITAYYPDVKLYMLYNDELEARDDKRPSDTSIFGTNILLTLGVTIIGKDTSKWFRPFESLNQLIEFKENMRKAPEGNVPITISKFSDCIEISGRLSKPAGAGNINHDPNEGALSMISKCIRVLGWKKDIVITKHGVSQEYINKHRVSNKFLYNCNILSVRLENIEMPSQTSLPPLYWHYEKSSEKVTSILLHLVEDYVGVHGIYENHAGCERGYFHTKDGQLVTLPKKDQQGEDLRLPDVVLYDNKTNYVVVVEGKKLSTLPAGKEEIKHYGSIEDEYIKPNYPNAEIHRFISLFGGEEKGYIDDDVLIYMNNNGEIYLNPNAPDCVTRAFKEFGVNV